MIWFGELTLDSRRIRVECRMPVDDLETLLDECSSLEFEEYGWTSIEHMSWPDTQSVALSLLRELDDGTPSRDRWMIECSGVRSCRFTSADISSTLRLDPADPRVLEHGDTTQNLYYRGAARAHELVAELEEAHVELAGKTIPFRRYLNGEPLPLLATPYGLLADGPSFLLKEYQRVVEKHGLETSSTRTSPPRFWNGHAHQEQVRPLTGYRFASVEIVAEHVAAKVARAV